MVSAARRPQRAQHASTQGWSARSRLLALQLAAVEASEAEKRERGDAAREDNAKLLSDLQEVSQLIELLEVKELDYNPNPNPACGGARRCPYPYPYP